MRDLNNELSESIKESLSMHGKLAILFYKACDDWVIHKWGNFDKLSELHKNLFNKYKLAGMIEEADSLTLMELPQDEELIYKVLTCGMLEKMLTDLGLDSK